MTLLQTRTIATPKISRSEILALTAVLLLAALLNFLFLSQNGFGNSYYAAAVKSMLVSWKNFFYVSFDAAGFISVDKPPLGLWLQASSAMLFGFNGFSLMLPQALAGVGSVAILYFLVRKVGGAFAGFIAAVLLAISPINVVTNRSNILESLVVLTVLLATWAILHSIEQKSLSWLLVGGAFIGIGFNIKGLETWLVVPVLIATYLFGVQLAWRIRFLNLGLMLLIIICVSLAWIVTVDLTPSSQRPYVDSTLTNSEFDLTFNYNGTQRLFGEPSYGGKPPVIKHDKGDPGPIRLFQSPLASQVGWFLPFALLSLMAGLWKPDWGNLRLSLKRGYLLQPQYSLLLWGGWLITAGSFFSVALRFNQYYMAVFAPATCAMVGYGVVSLWRDMASPVWRGWLLLIAFGATALEQIIIMTGFPDWNNWQLPLLIAICVAGVLLLGTMRILLLRNLAKSYLKVISAATLVTLLIVPLWWVSVSLTPNNAGEFPLSGPNPLQQGNFIVPEPDQSLLDYLKANLANERFFIATSSIEDAGSIALATDKAVMAMGGYSGYAAILTLQSLVTRVKAGEVKFFLIPFTNLQESQAQALYSQEIAATGNPFTTSYTNALTHWISDNCQPIPPNQWQTIPQLLKMQLYKCIPLAS
ncbi:glycosyltransferase family 39 protein [Candidatus Chlorohelix sp.]|uniref:ArnT family glycosyltransferase n=1 Tax=Candidatus Chlorohelix sp. TaxID=3139201 RepID=UPI003075A6CF